MQFFKYITLLAYVQIMAPYIRYVNNSIQMLGTIVDICIISTKYYADVMDLSSDGWNSLKIMDRYGSIVFWGIALSKIFYDSFSGIYL